MTAMKPQNCEHISKVPESTPADWYQAAPEPKHRSKNIALKIQQSHESNLVVSYHALFF
jgi:hypothetical protein